MNRKLIFLDIDGTLTAPGCNNPPESALEAVRAARGGAQGLSLHRPESRYAQTRARLRL